LVVRVVKLFMLVPLFCGGCASVSINDLALSAVHVVDGHDQAELARPGDMRPILARMAGDPSLLSDPRLEKESLAAPTERPHQLLIRVEFSSLVDFSKINYGDNLGTEIFFCDRPDAHTLIGMPYVYSNGQIVPSEEVSQTSSTAGDSLSKYYVFFRVFERFHPSNPPLESFDLRTHPEDVCFKLVGGAYRALGYSSNTIRVPSATITAALGDFPGSAAWQ
jgi:hypothetical protein